MANCVTSWNSMSVTSGAMVHMNRVHASISRNLPKPKDSRYVELLVHNAHSTFQSAKVYKDLDVMSGQGYDHVTDLTTIKHLVKCMVVLLLLPQGQLMDKVNVNGKQSIDIFDFLKVQSGSTGSIKWNFTKFVVARDGKTVSRWASMFGETFLQTQLDVDVFLICNVSWHLAFLSENLLMAV